MAVCNTALPAVTCCLPRIRYSWVLANPGLLALHRHSWHRSRQGRAPSATSMPAPFVAIMGHNLCLMQQYMLRGTRRLVVHRTRFTTWFRDRTTLTCEIPSQAFWSQLSCCKAMQNGHTATAATLKPRTCPHNPIFSSQYNRSFGSLQHFRASDNIANNESAGAAAA